MVAEGDLLDLELLRRQVGGALAEDLGLERVENGSAPRLGDRPLATARIRLPRRSPAGRELGLTAPTGSTFGFSLSAGIAARP
jgi:hypothetical protein